MNKSLLVIRDVDKFSRILTENGFEVINLPMIQSWPVENFEELDAKLDNLEIYDGLFLTSPKAAEGFLDRLITKNLKFDGKIYVLGNRLKTLFEKTNFEIVSCENANTAEELINSFDDQEFAGKRFLFVSGDKSRRTIPELLKNKAQIDEIIVYRTIENSIDKELLAEITEKFHQKKVDWVILFSPSGIESFIKTFGKERLKAVRLAVIGKTTAKKATGENLKVDFISSKANAENFAFELIEYLGKINCESSLQILF